MSANRNIFKFKQFDIVQDNAPMKIGTDGVLLGAWAHIEQSENILDIGTGTGLIALMAAQRNPKASITAIELNDKALKDAKINFKQSPWTDRLNLIHTSFQKWVTTQTFDAIISNPPFFDEDIQSPDTDRQMARHSTYLPLQELIGKAKLLLNKQGTINLILPADKEMSLKEIVANERLFLHHICYVHGQQNKPVKRILVSLGLEEKVTLSNQLIIEKARHHYTKAYTNLTRAFYLNM
jgi:tRNA1Val (adenine37-N6)-methyltransferase